MFEKIQKILCALCVVLAIALMVEGFIINSPLPFVGALFCVAIVYITVNAPGYE